MKLRKYRVNLPERSCFHNQASSEQYHHGELYLQLSSNSDSAAAQRALYTHLSANSFVPGQKQPETEAKII